ncbi:MAG: hypothetical protein WC509_04975 [Candidatus Izemoplasmatales bacterium]
MKRIVSILILILVSISCAGCFDSQYRDSSCWDITDTDFMDGYYNYYLDNISSLVSDYGFDFTRMVIVDDVNRFSISYYNDDELVIFHFLNDTGGFGAFRSEFFYFNFDKNNLLDFSKYQAILSFITEVNELVAFDFQGSSDTYQELFDNNIDDEPNTYYYHSDSVVGNVGYWVMWGDNYSDTETRWYIAFKFRSLLKTIAN